MKKKALALFLALALTVGLASCNGTILPTQTTTGTTTTTTTTPAPTTTTTTPSTTSTTTEPIVNTTTTSTSTTPAVSTSTTTTTGSQTDETYTVTWVNYNGTELEVDTNVRAGATPSYDGATPTKAEDADYTYTFKEWSPALASVSANTTYTATFTASPKSKYVVIENKDKEIPTELTFTGTPSGVTATLNIGSMKVGTYSDKNFMSSSKNLDGVSMMAYRAVGGSGYVTIKPDSYLYKDTAYHGAEGAIFNSNAIGGINSVEITYKTTDAEASGKTNPNVTFGDSLECDDYLYYLDPSSSDNTVTINVNNSEFKYFSINTGDYTTKVSTVVLKCDSKSSTNADVKAAGGEGKYRVNPVTLDKSTLVPGQTKVTLPTNIAYDSVTKTYTATSSKTLTYYTSAFVESHPSVIADATITDPMEVCMYYTTFGTWPANYSKSPNSIKSIFGSDTRQVSQYDRKNGYATSVPFNDNGNFVYYELDINFDGTYTTSSRGTGRVVAWDLGFTTTGYTKAPVCVYTDDHYNTWLEYYNNGTWSNRYNGEGVVTGIKYSAPTTVELTNFDYNIVAGDPNKPIPAETGPEVVVDVDSTALTDNDTLYYGNFAPKDIFKLNTASFQRVTNMIGVMEGARYIIAYSNDSVALDDRNGNALVKDGNTFKLNTNYDYKSLKVYGFEKANDDVYFFYSMNFDESDKRYLVNPGKSGKGFYDGQGGFTVGFSNGNFIIGGAGLTYQYNPTNNGLFRMYTAGSQNPVQLYRFCDEYDEEDNLVYNSDIKTDETSQYRKVKNDLALFDNSKYLIVCATNNKCLTDDENNSFVQAFGKLYTQSDTYFDLILVKHETESTYALEYLDWNAGVHFISVLNNELVLDAEEPAWFNISFDLIGNVEIKYNDYFLAYGDNGYGLYTRTDNKELIQLYRLCGNKDINPVAPDISIPEGAIVFDYVTDASDINENNEYLIVSKAGGIFWNFNNKASLSSKNKLYFEDGDLITSLNKIHIVKHETYDVYALYVIVQEYDPEIMDMIFVNRYFYCEENSNEINTNKEIKNYFELSIADDGLITLKPCIITETGIEPILYYGLQPSVVYSEYSVFGFNLSANLDVDLYLYQISE